MRRALPLLVVALLLALFPVFAFGQAQNSALSSSLAKEEQLLGPSGPPSEQDLIRLETLVAKIRHSGDSALLSRAELLLVLFRERVSSKARRETEDRAIGEEAKAIRGYRWHRTKGVLVKTGFWVGLSSLGLLGVSQAVKSWATNRYLDSPTVATAKPYFITGEISQLATVVGTFGALGGFGLAWVLEINPFDIPAPRSVGTAPSYPRNDMSPAQKTTYLEGVRKDYERQQKRATGLRKASFAFLSAGLTGALATGLIGYLGNLEYQKYTASTNAADAASYHEMVNIYQYITIGTASLALVGLTGAMVGYLYGPDPAQFEASIQILDHQLEVLRQGG